MGIAIFALSAGSEVAAFVSVSVYSADAAALTSVGVSVAVKVFGCCTGGREHEHAGTGNQ